MRILRSSRDKCHTWTGIASTLHRPVSHRATDENRVAFASGGHARQPDVSVLRVRGTDLAAAIAWAKRLPRAGFRVERICLRQCRVCRVQFCNKKGGSATVQSPMGKTTPKLQGFKVDAQMSRGSRRRWTSTTVSGGAWFQLEAIRIVKILRF